MEAFNFQIEIDFYYIVGINKLLLPQSNLIKSFILLWLPRRSWKFRDTNCSLKHLRIVCNYIIIFLDQGLIFSLPETSQATKSRFSVAGYHVGQWLNFPPSFLFKYLNFLNGLSLFRHNYSKQRYDCNKNPPLLRMWCFWASTMKF